MHIIHHIIMCAYHHIIIIWIVCCKGGLSRIVSSYKWLHMGTILDSIQKRLIVSLYVHERTILGRAGAPAGVHRAVCPQCDPSLLPNIIVMIVAVIR